MTTKAVHDPWNGDLLAEVEQASAAKAEEAALLATRAFASTKKMPSYARQQLLRGIAERLRAERDALAGLIAREAGKPITAARTEVDRAVVTFGLAADEAVRIGGEVIPLDLSEATAAYRGFYQRVPRGPVLAITPFNFPLNLVAHKVAPALACGAPVVVKPAPQTPLTALRLAEIARDAGAPDGMLQVLPCENDVAEQLVRSDAFAVLSFTGSDVVGWHLKSIAGRKVVTLELGGNAACIVHDDAPDLDGVAARIAASAFSYAGQVCIKTQRLYVQRRVVDRLLDTLLPRVRAIAPADPQDGATLLGPMIDEKAATRVASWIEDGVRGGGEALASGPRDRNRLPPAVLRFGGDGRGLRVVEDEAFGPVLTVHPYDTWEEAIAYAGGTRFGLQAGIFTDSIARMRAAFDDLDVGGLVVGDVPSVRVDAMPYGGMRDSGLGREGVRFAIEEMTDRKMLVMRGG